MINGKSSIDIYDIYDMYDIYDIYDIYNFLAYIEVFNVKLRSKLELHLNLLLSGLS